MIKKTAALIALLILLFFTTTIDAFAQQIDATNKEFYNLNCEKVPPGRTFPSRWNSLLPSTKHYITRADTLEKHSGKYALFITPRTGESKPDSGFIAFPLPAKFAAKQITLKGWLKLQNVTGHAGIMIRINDFKGNLIGVAGLSEQINGTQDWKQYAVSLPLPDQAAIIYIGPVLAGAGKLWADDFEILLDGIDVRDAPLKPGYATRKQVATTYGNNPRAGGHVKLKDANLYYEIYGKGQPLLLLHGNNQSISDFAAQIPQLSKSFKVIAVDTRGQGQSTDESKGPLTYDQFAGDMKYLLDALHITRTNILGWSDGGNTGLIMAIKYPSYVDKLAITGAVLNPSIDAINPTVLDEIRSHLKEIEADTGDYSTEQKRLLNLMLNEPHISVESLKTIKAPVLVMAGENDAVNEQHTRLIAKSIPNSKLFIFPGATHYVPREKPAEFNKEVLLFLESNSRVSD